MSSFGKESSKHSCEQKKQAEAKFKELRTGRITLFNEIDTEMKSTEGHLEEVTSDFAEAIEKAKLGTKKFAEVDTVEEEIPQDFHDIDMGPTKTFGDETEDEQYDEVWLEALRAKLSAVEDRKSKRVRP